MSCERMIYLSPEEKIRSYLPLVDFIAEIACPGSEVVLHDVRNKDKSLVAIRNGQISGRDIGEPMTDFASRILSRGQRENKNYLTNYIGKAGNSGKFLKASTYFIRDDNNEIIGMLGINTDISAFSEMHRILTQIMAVEDDIRSDSPEDNSREDKDISVKEMVNAVMEQILNAYVVDASHMTGEEKREVVDILNERGVFLLKGTIAEVAQRLEVSEQTVYRYLK